MQTLPTLSSSTTHDQVQPSVAAKQAAFTEHDRQLISRKFIRLISILKIILEEESNTKPTGTTEKGGV